jgi:hypothetical protein
MKKILIISIFILASMFSPQKGSAKTEEKTNQYLLKAAYIVNFAEFVEWPDISPNTDRNSCFIIGVIGKTPVYKYLDENAKVNKIMIRNKNVKVISISKSNYHEIKKCNLLFISSCSHSKFNRIMEAVGNLPILTVGDTKNYENEGVMINLFSTPDDRIRFNVNIVAAKKNGIQLTSKIVMYAIAVIK